MFKVRTVYLQLKILIGNLVENLFSIRFGLVERINIRGSKSKLFLKNRIFLLQLKTTFRLFNVDNFAFRPGERGIPVTGHKTKRLVLNQCTTDLTACGGQCP